MSFKTNLSVNIDPALKVSAEKVLARIGLSLDDAVTLFLRAVVAHNGLPPACRVPNEETREAIAELARGEGQRMTLEEFCQKFLPGKRD